MAFSKSQYRREYESFLRQLKQVREEARVTQIQLASRLGQTQSAVSKMERGERRLDVVELRAVCEALEVPLMAFIRRLEREWKS